MQQYKAVCRNPWCKATFLISENDMVVVVRDDQKSSLSNQTEKKEAPKECPKCRSFNNDLSGGIEWKEKEYEGNRNDMMPHEIKYKVTNFRL